MLLFDAALPSGTQGLLYAANDENMGEKPLRYYTVKALARVLGMGEEEIAALTRRGIIRDGLAENGLYTIEESAREVIAAIRKPEERNRSANYANERARLMRVRRQSAEHDLALKEKDLHKTEDVERIVLKILARFKARIRAIPSSIAPQCAKLTDKEQIFDLLKQATDEALQELSDIEFLFDEEKSQ